MQLLLRTGYIVYRCESISLDRAKFLLNNFGYTSYIGHQSTAEILTKLLDVPVNYNKDMSFQNIDEVSLILSLNSRAPEGIIYSKEEIEKIGYSFKLLTRYE